MTLAYVLLTGSDIDEPLFSHEGRERSRASGIAEEHKACQGEDDTNASLVEGVVRGDEQAFEALYHLLWAPLVNFAHALIHDAEIAQELVGDVFANLWQRRAEWRPLTAQSYLFGAVRNRALNHRRSQARARMAMNLAAGDDRFGGSPDTPDVRLLEDEKLQALHRALRQVLADLPESQHTLLVLRWQRQMRWEEIARVLGISVAAAQQQHSRLLKSLRVTVEAMLR